MVATMVAVASLAGCGFQPVEGADDVRGRVALAEARSPVEYAYRERLFERLGAPGVNAARLVTEIAIEETGAAISQQLDTTRFQLSGSAEWRLVGEGGSVMGEGRVVSLEGFDATSNPFAVRAARQAAVERLGVDLAEKVRRGLIGALR